MRGSFELMSRERAFPPDGPSRSKVPATLPGLVTLILAAEVNPESRNARMAASLIREYAEDFFWIANLCCQTVVANTEARKAENSGAVNAFLRSPRRPYSTARIRMGRADIPPVLHSALQDFQRTARRISARRFIARPSLVLLSPTVLTPPLVAVSLDASTPLLTR